ncbi:uncharacterized protein LOC143422889 [Xylocopa sonorina]|uniref:uncharacterized protein LOC143422889 n=1 Tax=Xylocopa sonorina TaxID=1818115 RepID=UPI00403AD232
MTAITDKSTVENSACLPPNERNLYVPQQLLEINELLKSINTRLEDCALEWQAEISRKQWKIFHSKVIGGILFEQSLLVRTYFTEKELDEAFQHLLSCNKIFTEYFKNFIDLLQRETASDNKKTCTQNPFYDNTRDCKELNNNNNNNSNNTKSMQLLSLNNQHLNGEKKIQDQINNISIIQNSFTDVIKAKVNFDTKFLGFEAVLHKATSTSNNVACFCQDCSNSMQTTYSKSRKLRNVTISQRNHTLSKTKRLTRSSKTLSKKRKDEKPSIIMGDAGDQLFLKTH